MNVYDLRYNEYGHHKEYSYLHALAMRKNKPRRVMPKNRCPILFSIFKEEEYPYSSRYIYFSENRKVAAIPSATETSFYSIKEDGKTVSKRISCTGSFFSKLSVREQRAFAKVYNRLNK